MNYTAIDEDIQILYKDERVVGIYKPSGYHVHQHQDSGYPVPRSQVCLYQVRDMVGQYVYPVHRLDAPTSGVMIFALDSASARDLANEFQSQRVNKTYEVVVRGWLSQNVGERGSIDLDLELDSTKELVKAVTEFELLGKTELPIAVGKRHASARYSLVRVFPKTGRYHQIRRHFQRKNHPVVGDTQHGDAHHNRFFRNELKIDGLLLRSVHLGLELPWAKSQLALVAPESEKWQRVKRLFQ